MAWWLMGLAAAGPVAAQDTRLGDLDGDGIATVRDVARIVGHIRGTAPLDPGGRLVADVTGDGAVNQADVDEVVLEILGTRDPANLPLSTVRFTSPEAGEAEVAITRETVVHFTIPLAVDTEIGPQSFYATFGGRRLLTRVEVAGDRKKATLFHLEPLPSNARIEVTLIDDGLRDILGREVDLNGDGEAGGFLRMAFDTLSITPNPQTAVVGRVFASEPAQGQSGEPLDVPLAGVTITVDGAEETLRAVTDAQGNFTLSPCPAGSFFVRIDGRTSPQSSYPDGDYYPVVGKEWFAVAGRDDNLAGGTGTIYLPCICAGSLQTVSQTEETAVTFPQAVLDEFPELAGTELMVPANSLFGNDGTRGGKVGIAPVAPQRLPEPLPEGLGFPMVITIQTDGGTNFDQPVPVCLPNLPDPATGERLPPGSVSALWSFDHDTGTWEVAGSMTVTDDGLFVKTDPGVGVRQPGWHGSQPGTQVAGEGSTCPPDADDDEEETGSDGEPCPELSAWDYAKLAYTVTIELAQCAAELAGVAVVVKCAISIVNTTVNLISSAQKFQEQLNKGIGTLEGAKAFLAHAKDIKKALLIENDCIEDISPVSKAEQIFKCVGNVLSIGDAICKTGPDMPPGCKVADNYPRLCGAVDNAKFIQSKAQSIIDFLKKYEKEFKLGLLCFTLDRLEDYVNDLLLPGAVLGPLGDPAAAEAGDDRPLTEEEVAGLTASVADLGVESGEVAAAGAQYGEIEKSFIQTRELADQQLQGMARTIVRAGQRPAGLTFWRIDLESGVVVRGKARSGERINAILGPELSYTLRTFNPTIDAYAEAPGFTPRNGRRSVLTPTIMEPGDAAGLADADGDGLPDLGEEVVGTDPADPDSDGDGISDRAELDQGTNPLDGIAVSTGVIASAPTRGSAEDICAVNNLAVTADGPNGISVFNVFSGLNPTRIAEIGTGGSAVAVACNGDLVAVAAYTAGLAVVDLGDPADIRVVRRVALGDAALAVTTSGPTAYVGTLGGRVVAVDMPTGTILDAIPLPGGVIRDLGVGGETLYVLQNGKVTTIPLDGAEFAPAGSAALPGVISTRRRPRLFVGGDTLYATWRNGFHIVDIGTDPRTPVHLQQVSTTQLGWKQIVANGSGVGIAAVGANTTNDGPHHVDLYDLGPDGRGAAYLTTLSTPGLAAAVSVFNGFAYVADSRAGLQVLNFRDFDRAGVPPTITLDSNFDLEAGKIEEGRLVRLTASVSDDVQVRNVTFLIDGVPAVVDGNFRFEHRFVAPPLAEKATITVRARAEDTGGNTALTPEITLTITPDAVPPEVRAFLPRDGALIGGIAEVGVEFSEIIDRSTLEAGGLELVGAGDDDVFGTGDDVAPEGGAITFREGSLTAFLAFPAVLDPGLYRIRVADPAADLAGNVLAEPAESQFRIFSDADDDGDGLADDWEPLLGLTPGVVDSDGDGVRDGDEDFDEDRLPNGIEVFIGTQPNLADTDGDGILDGDEDSDFDGLTDGQEVARGTDVFAIDTDGDGLDDLTETSEGSDPLDPASGTSSFVASGKVAYTNAVNGEVPETLATLSAASAPVTVTNALPGDPPETLTGLSTASRTVTFQNTLPSDLPETVPVSAASDVVTYENQADP